MTEVKLTASSNNIHVYVFSFVHIILIKRINKVIFICSFYFQTPVNILRKYKYDSKHGFTHIVINSRNIQPTFYQIK